MNRAEQALHGGLARQYGCQCGTGLRYMQRVDGPALGGGDIGHRIIADMNRMLRIDRTRLQINIE
ncbi:MAG: hypothetical protein ABW151_06500 [Pseudorhodoplanes sp.]